MAKSLGYLLLTFVILGQWALIFFLEVIISVLKPSGYSFDLHTDM
ncbi:hypothetical protein VV11_006315 [Trichodesmium erythraeum 21-75]|nr:hypothetical protein [Trichodesmium erythraeum 21-75]